MPSPEGFNPELGTKFVYDQTKQAGLHASLPIEKTAESLRREGEQISNDPLPKLDAYFKNLQERHSMFSDTPDDLVAAEQQEARREAMLETYSVPVNEETAEAFFAFNRKIAREQGITLDTDSMPMEIKIDDIQRIHDDQLLQLTQWTDELRSTENGYPIWFQYWVLTNVLKLKAYNDQTDRFDRRGRVDFALFPELDRESLALTYDALRQHLSGEELDLINEDGELAAMLKTGNFAKIYGEAQNYGYKITDELKASVDGEWHDFTQSEDSIESQALSELVRKYRTGWCTSGEATAHTQLSRGDFYIYCTPGEDGQREVPRVAIRMEDGLVAEVRGINSKQELEPELADAVMERAKTLSGGQEYFQKAADMKRLAELDKKKAADPDYELTVDELRFLHQVDRDIVGFGYGIDSDPRILELLEGRDDRKDLAAIFGCSPEQICMDQQEFFDNAYVGNVYRYMDSGLTLNKTTVDKFLREHELKLPRHIRGSLYFEYGVTSLDDITLPEKVGGTLGLRQLTDPNGLVLPESVGGAVMLDNLENGGELGIALPKSVGKNLYLPKLKNGRGVVMPESVGNQIILSSLINADGLTMPNHVGGDIDMPNMEDGSGLEFPELLYGDLDLGALRSGAGIKFPATILGTLNINSMQGGKETILPKRVGDDLGMSYALDVSGIEFPDAVGGTLWLHDLKTANGITLPRECRGSIMLNSLVTAEGLQFPEGVGGSINLHDLKTAYGLVLPKSVVGSVELDSLPSTEELVLPEIVGGLVVLQSISEADHEQLVEQRPDLRILYETRDIFDPEWE